MSRERVTILVAGENSADLEKIAIFLRAEGFKVQTVSDRTAIMMLARSETTDLILLRRLRLTNNLLHCVSRFSPAAQSLAEADIIWSCTCPKTGVVTPVENPCSITSYIGLH